MRTIFLLASLFATGGVLAQGAADPEVKKSSAGICHERGTGSYGRTKNFEPYDSLEKCVASGGRRATNVSANKDDGPASAEGLKRDGGKIAFIAILLAIVGGGVWLAKRGAGRRSAKLNELEQKKWAGHRREP
jgi:hypothetical protein